MVPSRFTLKSFVPTLDSILFLVAKNKNSYLIIPLQLLEMRKSNQLRKMYRVCVVGYSRFVTHPPSIRVLPFIVHSCPFTFHHSSGRIRQLYHCVLRAHFGNNGLCIESRDVVEEEKKSKESTAPKIWQQIDGQLSTFRDHWFHCSGIDCVVTTNLRLLLCVYQPTNPLEFCLFTTWDFGTSACALISFWIIFR